MALGCQTAARKAKRLQAKAAANGSVPLPVTQSGVKIVPAQPRYSVAELHTMLAEHPDMQHEPVRRKSIEQLQTILGRVNSPVPVAWTKLMNEHGKPYWVSTTGEQRWTDPNVQT